MKCPSCNQGTLKKATIREEQYGVFLGEHEGLRCSRCRETFFDEKTTNTIMEKAKEKGIFGMEIKTKIGKSGNSLAVRIPKKIADVVDFKEGKEVRIHPAGKKIIIEE